MTRDFLHLFRGNPAVVGLDDAGRGTPGPLRLDIPDERKGKWLTLAEAHLMGTCGIGVYPYNHDNGSVAWGCVDFDEGEIESWSHALNLREVLIGFDVESWIERSRSKGYHLWVFSEWVPAHWMRWLLLGACRGAEVPEKEVNPKSESLDSTQLGNFVRLPYLGTKAGPTTHQIVLDLLGQPLPLDLFTSMALESVLPASRVVSLAKMLYNPPRKPQAAHSSVAVGPWQERLEPLARVQLQEGPKNGSDRSSYLMAFGYACAESGLEAPEIIKAVRAADAIHCHKYEGRKDAFDRYSDIATKSINTYEESNASW